MAEKSELERKWKPILRWSEQFTAAQIQVLAEESVWVPFSRMAAHCYIETGGTGDPTLDSRGVNNPRCDKPGVDCSADGRAKGLFQIWWPPFRVDWNRIKDPGYNSYCGAKTLAIRYKQCGNNWRAASMAFFAGSCTDIGVIDTSTNTDQALYDQRMTELMRELGQLGIGDTNPKEPTADPTTDGIPNMPTGEQCVEIFGKEICVPIPNLGDMFSGFVESSFPKIVLIVIGLAILIVGLRSVV